MAVITDLMQTYDQSDGNREFVAEGVHMISPYDTPLQMLLPKIQVKSTQPKWIEDELQGTTSALDGAITTTATSIDVYAGDGADKLPSDVATYNVVIRVDQEYMLVTATSTDALTVTRGYGSTTGAPHDTLSVVHIVSVLEDEGDDGKVARARGRSKESNYLQTFSRTVEVAGVQGAVEHLGGVSFELNHQVLQTYRQLGKELEKTLLMGVAAQAGNGSSTFRTMGGLWAMVSTNREEDSGDVDTTAIEADIQTIWAAGGVPNLIVCDGSMAQGICNLYTDRIRIDEKVRIGGANINAIVNPLAPGLIIVLPHRLMAAGEYFMLDTTKVALGYLRPFFEKDLAEDGDTHKRWIGGDYTLELMNEEAHAYRYGLN